MAMKKTRTSFRTGRAGLAGITSVMFYAVTTSQANAAMAAVICMILGLVQGDIGRAAATMGVLAVAFGASLGKVSWGLAVTVAIGISLIFQASYYASYFGIAGTC